MKMKRILLIICLIALSIGCYQVMNTRYNPLARYQYVTKENRDLIIDHMSQDDINYLVQQKIKPEQFMDFIQLEGFNAKNILYYDECRKAYPVDLNYIVSFVNKYKEKMKLSKLSELLKNYGYSVLEEYYNQAYPYIKDADLVERPAAFDSVIKKNQTLYKYVPQGLVAVDYSIVPSASKTDENSIKIKSEVIEPLKEMINALEKENHETAGGLILISGFINYEEQIKLYEKALISYGVDNFQRYEDYPGQSENQLGYSVEFTLAGKSEEQIKNSQQAKWLNENAKKYGFVVRYPKEEKTTGKVYRPLLLRYVGKDITMEENFSTSTFFEGE